MSNVVHMVVGGGLVGLATATLLARQGKAVTLVEAAPECGGLLRSVRDQRDLHYDYGTHIPCLTGQTELDEILYGPAEDLGHNWHRIHKIAPMARHGGSWNQGGSLLDAHVMPADTYERGVEELLARKEPAARDTDLAAFLNNSIGPTFAEELVGPVLQKLYGRTAVELVPASSIFYFGLNRVTILDRERTNELRQDPVFAAKLACHTLDDYYAWDGNRQIDAYLYPRGGRGCGYWVDRLVEQARAAGVEILTGTRIESMSQQDGRITEVQIAGEAGPRQPSHVFWSAPPALARRALGHGISPPATTFLTTSLHHLSFDKALLVDRPEYIWNWEPRHKTFRATLYPNLDPDSPQPRLTAEVLSQPGEEPLTEDADVLREMQEIGIVADGAQILSTTRQVLKNTFPVPDSTYVAEAVAHVEALADIPNLRLVGRYAGRKWLQNEVLVDAFEQVAQL